MLYFLWAAHWLISAVVFAYFVFSSSYMGKDMKSVWRGHKNLLFKVLLSLLYLIVWGISAFFWEFSLPYLKSPKFRNALDVYFGD